MVLCIPIGYKGSRRGVYSSPPGIVDITLIPYTPCNLLRGDRGTVAGRGGRWPADRARYAASILAHPAMTGLVGLGVRSRKLGKFLNLVSAGY